MKHSREAGFAMLLVYVMAASVALMLYMEMPRVAFEAQRNREEMLIARGEEYMRGIQLYVRKFKKYPAKIEDLENTNQIRFLRRRYVDPMTGKEEWRIIHVGPNGQFLDSLTRKQEKKEQKSVNTFTYEATSLSGQSGTAGQDVQSAVPKMRESEQRNLGRQPFGNTPNPAAEGSENPNSFGGVQPNGAPPPQQQQRIPPQNYFGAPMNPQVLIQQQGSQGNQPISTYDSFAPPGYKPPQPGAGTVWGAPQTSTPQQQQQQQSQNSFTGSGGFVGGGSAGVNPNQGRPLPIGPGNPAQPGLYGQGAPQVQGGIQQPNNPALGLIQQILTSPRPGGAPMGTPMQGQTLGGGIAGFASTMERRGIKVYKEKDSYHEWEFIYDPAEEQGGAQQAGIPGAPNSDNQGTPIGASAGASTSSSGSSTSSSSSSSSGSSSSFVGGGGYTPPANSGTQTPRPATPNLPIPGQGQPVGRPGGR